MKTAKQLQSIMLDDRFGKGGEFYHYCKNLIYKGHTCKDRICAKFKLPDSFDGYEHQLPKKCQFTWAEIEAYAQTEFKQADNRIISRFEKYRIQLNEKLNQLKNESNTIRA